MSMFGRVIMVGNLACYNQVQVGIAIKVIQVMNMLKMMMITLLSSRQSKLHCSDNIKTKFTFRKQRPCLPWTWPSSSRSSPLLASMCTGREQFIKATGIIVKAFVCGWYSQTDHTHVSIRPCSNLLNSTTKLIYQ